MGQEVFNCKGRIFREELHSDVAFSRSDFNDAMTNENAVFPQLSTDVAEDEAEVKITTTEGDITVKLFPKYAPLAVVLISFVLLQFSFDLFH